jgi:hypothetical protein
MDQVAEHLPSKCETLNSNLHRYRSLLSDFTTICFTCPYDWTFGLFSYFCYYKQCYNE